MFDVPFLMSTFKYTFVVRAPLQRVSEFHHHPRALKLLSPPPMIVQLHHADPLAEGSVAEFTLWLGFIPIRWKAVHTHVSEHGFTDTQAAGPMAHWLHTHRFEKVDERTTRVHEHIEYAYKPGLAGLFSRLLFSPPGLWFLFSYRAWATRMALERS